MTRAEPAAPQAPTEAVVEGPVVAIIGTGLIGTVHARAARSAGGRLAGVAASTPARAERSAKRLGTSGYATWIEAIADPAIQVVHICTPNALHEPIARAALAAGKHVVCEKPLGMGTASKSGSRVAAELATVAAARGLVATVPFVYRYYPMVRDARRRVSVGELGTLTLAHGSYLQDWLLAPTSTDWRVDPLIGGSSRAFADIGGHWCDLLEFVGSRRIVELSATTSIVHRARPIWPGDAEVPVGAEVHNEDIACVTFRLADGAIGSCVISQVSAGSKNRFVLQLHGTKASLAFDHERPEWLTLADVTKRTAVQRDPDTADPSVSRFSRLPAGHPQGLQDCFDAFVADTYAAVESGAPLADGVPDFAAGARAARLTDAVLDSARTRGAWVATS